jgi:alpha-amylase
MKRSHLALVLLASAIQQARSLSPSAWRSQSIYQVLTDRFARTDLSTTASCNTADQNYCGGTYLGLISKLDYIQGMGFTAIWISPIVKNIDGHSATSGSAYHGYWAQDIYSVNSNFGTADDLKALSTALKSRGMYLMVDVVTNHMAYNGASSSVDYSSFNPFSNSGYFHSPCDIDYNNQTSIETCWEVNGSNEVVLPDLRTENSDVRAMWNTWIQDMISTYGIDGLRIDSAKHQEKSFYPQFSSAAGGLYMVGEVLNGDPSYTTDYQNYMDGVLDYPSYYWITAAFESTSGDISSLVNGVNTLKSDSKDTSLLGSFLENHDQPRFASVTQDMSLAKNAIAFTVLKDGIPIIYQGQEQHYSGSGTPNQREAIWLSGYSTTATLYTFITTLNALRSRAIAQDSTYLSYQAYPVYSDSNTIVMRKGYTGYQVIGVYTNVGSSGSKTLTLTSSMTGFTASQSLVDVLSCTAFTADSSGNLAVTLSSGLPRVFYPLARLTGSGICPSLTGSSTSSSTSYSTSKTSTSTGYSTTFTTSTKTTTTTTTTASASCTATAVPITFSILATTSYGETIKLAGNVTALGSWNTASAIALSASSYTSSNPLWTGTVSLPANSGVAYKFIRVSSSGGVTWESGNDRTLAVGCQQASVSESWS